MVVIRLARHGACKRPFYRIVVADQRKKRDGRIIEQLGVYDPGADPSLVQIDLEKAEAWIEKGAQPSDRVAKIIACERGAKLPEHIAHRAALKTAQKEAQDKLSAAEKKKAQAVGAQAAKETDAAAASAAEPTADSAAAEPTADSADVEPTADSADAKGDVNV